MYPSLTRMQGDLTQTLGCKKKGELEFVGVPLCAILGLWLMCSL